MGGRIRQWLGGRRGEMGVEAEVALRTRGELHAALSASGEWRDVAGARDLVRRDARLSAGHPLAAGPSLGTSATRWAPWQRAAARLGTLGPLLLTQMGMNIGGGDAGGGTIPLPVTVFLASLTAGLLAWFAKTTLLDRWGAGGRLLFGALSVDSDAMSFHRSDLASTDRIPAGDGLDRAATADAQGLLHIFGKAYLARSPHSITASYHLRRGAKALAQAIKRRDSSAGFDFAVVGPPLDRAADHFARAALVSYFAASVLEDFIVERPPRSVWMAIALERLATAQLLGGRVSQPILTEAQNARISFATPGDAWRRAAGIYESTINTTTEPWPRAYLYRRLGRVQDQLVRWLAAEHVGRFGIQTQATDDILSTLDESRRAYHHSLEALEAAVAQVDVATAVVPDFPNRVGAFVTAERAQAQRLLNGAIADEHAAYDELTQRARTEPAVAGWLGNVVFEKEPAARFPAWQPYADWRFAEPSTIASVMRREASRFVARESHLRRELAQLHAAAEPIRARQQRRAELQATAPMQAALAHVVRSVLEITGGWIADTNNPFRGDVPTPPRMNPMRNLDARALEAAGLDVFAQSAEEDAAQLERLIRRAREIGQPLDSEEPRHQMAADVWPRVLRATQALGQAGALLENVRAGLVEWILADPEGWGPSILADLPAYADHHPRLVRGVLADVAAARPHWRTSDLAVHGR